MKKRLNAYTIMEVTIAMLLAGMVIMITYTVYTIVVRTYSTYDIKNKEVAEQILLDELLKKDFTNAEAIFLTDSGMICKTAKGEIRYRFQPEYLIRTFGIIDTFKVKISQTAFLFEDTEVLPGENMVPIDELHLNLVFRNKFNNYSYTKRYSADELIKITTDAIN